ncbi:DUF1573 domain-containing protein [Bacteroides sp. 224]|uniref:DUF1573 domain-containing protein n=1 Tax=Bacteroides sp. 224 TaxID=2302936 RepID=UPI0013CFB116|nr:DUF1573 domain-containing protein [Bacteroides sp. 224]NDV66543.1 DUF1573 domain-containing protein [Bacteroides sp. 224]
MKNIHYLLFLLLFLAACKESDKAKITRLVKEWENKEVSFPSSINYSILGKDTTYLAPQRKYTIVSYLDSVGCTSCKLQLHRWKDVIAEFDSLSSHTIFFQFIFHAKDKREMIYLIRRDRFDYPVWIDETDSFNKLNKLPESRLFHTFLLNEQNRVVAIGDPMQNPKIKDLYLKIILGKDMKATLKTSVKVDQTVIDLGEFDWMTSQEVTFHLKNVGKNLLVINDVAASCGCVKVSYDKKPVKVGEDIELKVSYKADHVENFNKSIKVYTNAEDSPVELKVKGVAK